MKTSKRTKNNYVAITCIAINGMECQWCEQWEHKVCTKIGVAKISVAELL